MSIKSVTEVASRESTLDWKVHRTYVREYLVESNILTESPTTVETASLGGTTIPARLDSYPADLNALVTKLNAKQHRDNGYLWTVTVEYDSHLDIDPAKTDENPLARPALWSLSFEHGEKALQSDLDDIAIYNSANDPYDPPLTMDMDTPLIKIVINKASLDLALALSYQGTVNSDTWVTPYGSIAPGVAKLRLEAQEQWENNILYWQHTYTVALKYDKWRPLKVLDAGYYYRVAGEQRMFRDAQGAPLPHPSLLDGAGNKLPFGDPPLFNSFVVHREMVFTGVIP